MKPICPYVYIMRLMVTIGPAPKKSDGRVIFTQVLMSRRAWENVWLLICSLTGPSVQAAPPVRSMWWSGGGEGKLAAHTLDALMRADKQIYHRVRYTMIETSGYHRSIQKSMLAAHENRLRFMTEEEWLAAPPHPGSIVLANELLDAFPVYRLRCDQGTLQEGWVTWDRQAQAFAERWMPLCDPRLHAYLQQAGVKLAEGQVAEVNLAGPAWLERIAGALLRGRMVLIDYGDTAEELYAPTVCAGA
ncbi:SAM-dependent methyltransferase [Paenibacillus larvae]|nr:SAM-dependent methyltransferase [Paenibacillus larvae]MDT2238534.1 SAM-dependent methyltransferase [Paenibacillus larvae]MDT2241276.1 SAM-dependent methyltransferase [Paenibacillus larvae]